MRPTPTMTELTFLGTGNFLAPGRYWNSFLIDGSILMEPSPTALPNLRRAGAAAADLRAVMISHFHPDHTFGWPFLALELLLATPDHELSIVGPPGVREFLAGAQPSGRRRGRGRLRRDRHRARRLRHRDRGSPSPRSPGDLTGLTPATTLLRESASCGAGDRCRSWG